MSQLVVMRGLPASGKTTRAKEYASIGFLRVCRDDIRLMVAGKYAGLTNDQEYAVTVIEEGAVIRALQAGKNVVVDAMHLRPRYVRKWAKIALEYGADFDICELDVTLEDSQRRDRLRYEMGQRFVGPTAISKMARFLGKDGALLPVSLEDLQPAVEPVEPYVAPSGKPDAILVDIDGTLAHMQGRSPFDWKRVGEDAIDPEVRDIVQDFWDSGNEVILMSGRDAVCRKATERWLSDMHVPYDELYMRGEGDTRKDSIVKLELFDTHVRRRFNVRLVLDDRNQVVEMWRSLGLKCFQVAPGDF